MAAAVVPTVLLPVVVGAAVVAVVDAVDVVVLEPVVDGGMNGNPSLLLHTHTHSYYVTC